ncbi:hypothetical protein GCM10018966_098380 [Streptomyces yanii]
MHASTAIRRIRIARPAASAPEASHGAFVLAPTSWSRFRSTIARWMPERPDTVKAMLAGLDVRTPRTHGRRHVRVRLAGTVVRKGTLSRPAAQDLQLYRQARGLEALDAGTRRSLRRPASGARWKGVETCQAG